MDKNSYAYKKAKKLADEKFNENSSAYKSMYIVKMYKKFGGIFSNKKPKNKNQGLKRWIREEWVRINPNTGKPMLKVIKKKIKKYVTTNSSRNSIKKNINGKKINVKINSNGKPIKKTYIVEIKKRVPCGRNKNEKAKKGLCRPYKKISSNTPKTVREFKPNELKNRAKRKMKNPDKYIKGGTPCTKHSRFSYFYNCVKDRVVSINKSNRTGKKYKAIIEDTNTKKLRTIHFGALGYQHYRDSTKIKLYSHLNHNTLKRRDNYYSRHSGTKDKNKAIRQELSKSNGRLNAKLLSHVYLW